MGPEEYVLLWLFEAVDRNHGREFLSHRDGQTGWQKHLPVISDRLTSDIRKNGFIRISREDFHPINFAIALFGDDYEPTYVAKMRLTPLGWSRALQLYLQSEREAAELAPARESAVLSRLLMWVYQGGGMGAPASGVAESLPTASISKFVRPVDPESTHGVWISSNEARRAAVLADSLNLATFDGNLGSVRLTGYGVRCVTDYGGSFAQMSGSEKGRDSIQVQNGIVVTGGRARDVTFNQGGNSRPPADPKAAELAARVVELVAEHRGAIEQSDRVARDAQEVADELSGPSEAQDRDRIRDSLTRLSARVIGIDALAIAVQELWRHLFG